MTTEKNRIFHKPHLHHDADKELVDMMSHARRGLGELDPELHGQVFAIARRQHSRPLKVCLVPYLGIACHISIAKRNDKDVAFKNVKKARIVLRSKISNWVVLTKMLDLPARLLLEVNHRRHFLAYSEHKKNINISLHILNKKYTA